MKIFKEYGYYKELIERHIMDFIPEIEPNSKTLYDSMHYSLENGGKRIRPAMLLAACDLSGGDVAQALPYACAIEYIHTYSLIHDDLPSMDDDDMRRGAPTNHVAFGEAVAILAGDGLLTSAFEAMNKDMLIYFDSPELLKRRIRASYEISKGAGCKGMVAGQIADIESENKSASKELIDDIHLNKTAALMVAAVKAGAYLGGAGKELVADLESYGENIGLAFQIADDIQDTLEDRGGATADSGTIRNRPAYPTLYGLDESRKRFEGVIGNARKIIAPYYDNAEFFVELIDMIIGLAERGQIAADDKA
ncbi:MAG: polyprenyl synthetase family protein [Clostridiales Family XIII bacterium]|jgi:geranylgeranyl diphosphate synthase type II|nr:polyprenyl synthetase family protein [Clostridiales Family XIII bacterium]